MASAVRGASLASEMATVAMSTLINFATPNTGGPLDEVAHHVQNYSQSVPGMRSEVNKLVLDILLLDQDCNNYLPPAAGGMGGRFLGNPSVNVPAPQPPGS